MSRRRQLLIGGALFVVAVVVRVLLWTPSDRPFSRAPDATAYLGELQAGARIDRWTIVRVEARESWLAMVLSGPDGKHFQVELLRGDPEGPPPVASTQSLAVFILDRPEGAPPDEQLMGAQALAAELTKREEAGAKAPFLLTMRERRERFPNQRFPLE